MKTKLQLQVKKKHFLYCYWRYSTSSESDQYRQESVGMVSDQYQYRIGASLHKLFLLLSVVQPVASCSLRGMNGRWAHLAGGGEVGVVSSHRICRETGTEISQKSRFLSTYFLQTVSGLYALTIPIKVWSLNTIKKLLLLFSFLAASSVTLGLASYLSPCNHFLVVTKTFSLIFNQSLFFIETN